MEYKSYQHIEKLGREECEGVLNGTVTVQPKIDGSNAVLFLGDDGKVHGGSRKRELTLENDNRNFYATELQDEKITKYFAAHPNQYVFGEWLVKHTIGYYNPDAWNCFYVFDVVEDGRYLSYDEYVPMLKEFGIPYIPEIARLENPTIEEVAACINLPTARFLMPEDKVPEGVIAKNYAYKNKYGRTIWGKIVTEEFFNRKTLLGQRKHAVKSEAIEERLAEDYITEPVIRKEYAKILNEYPDAGRQEKIGRLLNAVFDNFIEEDLVTAVKRNKKSTIDFLNLRKVSDRKVKEVLREELFS